MKTKNPRLVFGDDEFTFFRVTLLTEGNKTNDIKKADRCLRYLMNYQPHQKEI